MASRRPPSATLRLQTLRENAPKTPDPGQRELICQDLAQQIRKEPDSIMRGEILRTIAAYGGRTADLVLRTAVRDTDADVRVIVCELWGMRATTRPPRYWKACWPATATATFAWPPSAAWGTRARRP